MKIFLILIAIVMLLIAKAVQKARLYILEDQNTCFRWAVIKISHVFLNKFWWQLYTTHTQSTMIAVVMASACLQTLMIKTPQLLKTNFSLIDELLVISVIIPLVSFFY